MQEFDYRNELRNLFQQKQTENPKYSGRAFTRDLGISVTAVHGVLNLTRHLAKSNLETIASKLNWSTEKFEIAIATTKLSEDPTPHLIDEDQFHFIADWIHLAILNLAKIPNISINSLSKRLGVEPEICEEALARLIRLQFVEIDSHNHLRRLTPSFGIRKHTPSKAIQAFHHSNLLLAQKALTHIPLEKRQFLTITAPSNQSKLAQLQVLIDEFRKQALNLFETENPTDIYFLNIQLYPVTHSEVVDDPL